MGGEKLVMLTVKPYTDPITLFLINLYGLRNRIKIWCHLMMAIVGFYYFLSRESRLANKNTKKSYHLKVRTWGEWGDGPLS